MSLKQRFGNRAALVEALQAPKTVQGDIAVAEAIADVGELLGFAPRQNLIVEGDTDRNMFFLLAGKAQFIVKGVRLYPREKNVSRRSAYLDENRLGR